MSKVAIDLSKSEQAWAITGEHGLYLNPVAFRTRSEAIAAHVWATDTESQSRDFDLSEYDLHAPDTRAGQEQRRLWRNRKRMGDRAVRVLVTPYPLWRAS